MFISLQGKKSHLEFSTRIIYNNHWLLYDMMYLLREPMGRFYQLPDIIGRELMPMITYSDFIQFVIMLCAIITVIVNLVHKK